MNITSAMANAINSLMPGNQVYKVGDYLRQALNGKDVRQLDNTAWVNPNVAASGNGESYEKGFKTITEGITYLNSKTGKGSLLLVAPGLYIEKSADVPVLTTDDNAIVALGMPEDTLWFGSGAAGTVSVATTDLLTIRGGNNLIQGMCFYNHKNTKASLVFDDTGAGYHGSFNVVRGCYFSPQAQDGVKYCIQYKGGNVNIIEDNQFYGALTAAILLTGNVGNPVRNVIRRNHFVGTAIGVHITSANYNTLIAENWFSAGSEAGEDMTNAIVISAGMNAGAVTILKNQFEQSAANAISDSKAGGSVFEMENSNAV